MTLDNEITAEVIQYIGDGRYKIKCNDDVNRIGLIHGILRRRINLVIGDKVKIQMRELEPTKCDIISKI